MAAKRPRTKLTHVDADGTARMVDTAAKPTTTREARAEATVTMSAAAADALRRGDAKKGDVFAVARIAGIQAAKQTPSLIPLCHTIVLTSVKVDFTWHDTRSVRVEASARATDRTGVEMEALVAASVAALTIYDMLKAVDRAMTITDVRVVAKSGGRSGDYLRRSPLRAP